METVSRLFGSPPAVVARGLEHLNGSLTLLLQSEVGNRWAFKHPTIADAFAALVAESAELIELYLQGAKVDQLLSEVVCGGINLQGASVRVPSSLYPMLMNRIGRCPLDWSTRRFLANRCDRAIREMYFLQNDSMPELVGAMSSELAYDSATNLLGKLHKDGLLPETLRKEVAAKISEFTVELADGAIFDTDDIHDILNDDEFLAVCAQFKDQVADRLDDYAWDLERSIISGDVSGALLGLKESMERYVRFMEKQDDSISPELIRHIHQLEDRAAELQSEEPRRSPSPVPPKSSVVDEIGRIFDDVDD